MANFKNWNKSSFVANQFSPIVSGDPSASVQLVGMIISNNSPSSDAYVEIDLYSGSVYSGKILPSGNPIEAGQSIYLDSKVFLMEYDYVRATSSISTVSVIANGVVL